MMFCPACGASLPEVAIFCPSCGKRLDSDGPAPENEPKQQQETQHNDSPGQQNNYAGPYIPMSRAEMKAKAKASLSGNWGIAIAVSLVGGLILSAAGAISFGIGGIILTGVISFSLNLFYLAITRGGSGAFEDLFAGFNRFGDTCITGVLVWAFTLLWSLLLVIPGLIKMYAYSMTFYIMNDQPELTGQDAITASRKLMDGNKWDLFVLQLSFILWLLLSGLTCGILFIVYVGPYMSATTAIFYDDIRQRQTPQA